MPTITLVEHNGTEHTVKGEIGQSIMQLALNAMVPGIQADCGGACSCATCHAVVDDNWMGVLPEMEDMESDMLEFASERQDNSRLTCQLPLSESMDGIKLHLPASQY